MHNKSNKVYLTELHQDHQEWLIALAFYKDELKSFSNRLGEVATANTASEIMQKVEHFQNQFDIQSQNIADLEHGIREDESRVVASVQANPVASEHRKLEDNENLRENMDNFERVFSALKTDFIKFLRAVL